MSADPKYANQRPDNPQHANVEVVTFGCRLNAYESEVVKKLATEAGATGTIIVNTCAVTAEAERQARQTVRRLRRDNPDAEIVVTGCAAQIDPQAWARMEAVDRVVGNAEKLAPDAWQAEARQDQIAVADIMTIRETAPHLLTGPAIEGFEDRARAFVQVQNGCDHRCTFCIIPYGRGNSRSVPIGEIVRQIRALVANGYREAVLTGVDVTSYGPDLPGAPTLGQMVRRLLAQVPELPRLRLSSIDVAEIDDDLRRLIAEEPRLMPHLHLSLQAGDDMILKRMKRRHTHAQAVDFCRWARSVREDIAFGCDIIAGFPTEDEAMFARSAELIEACDIAYTHVFPFSPRDGTPAARMPQLDRSIIKARAARLREAGATQRAAYLARQVGRTEQVLIEKFDDRGNALGRTERFCETVTSTAQASGLTTGQVLSMGLQKVDGDRLAAVPG